MGCRTSLLAFGAEVDAELLTLLIEMTALEAQGFRRVGDVSLMSFEFREERGALEGGDAVG